MTLQEILDYVTLNGRSNVTFTALVTRVEGRIAFMQDSTGGIYWTVPAGVSLTYPDIQVGNIVTIQANCELYYGTLQIVYGYVPDSIVLESSGNEVSPTVITEGSIGYCQLQSFTGTVTNVVLSVSYPYFIVNNGTIDLAVFTSKLYFPSVGSMIENVRIGQAVTVVGNSFYRNSGDLAAYPNQIYMIDTDDVPVFIYKTINETKNYVIAEGGYGVLSTLTGIISRIDTHVADNSIITYYIQDNTGGARISISSLVSIPQFVIGNKVALDGYFDCTNYILINSIENITNVQVLSSNNIIDTISFSDYALDENTYNHRLMTIEGLLLSVTKLDSFDSYGYGLISGSIVQDETTFYITITTENSQTFSEIGDGSNFNGLGIGRGYSEVYILNGDLVSYTKEEPEFQMKPFIAGMFLKKRGVTPGFQKVKFLKNSDYNNLILDPSTAEQNTIYYKYKTGLGPDVLSYVYNYDTFPNVIYEDGLPFNNAVVTVFQDSGVDKFTSDEIAQIVSSFEYDLSDENNLLFRLSKLTFFKLVIQTGINAQYQGLTENRTMVTLSSSSFVWNEDHYQGKFFFSVHGYERPYLMYNLTTEYIPNESYIYHNINTSGNTVQTSSINYSQHNIESDLFEITNIFRNKAVVLSRTDPQKFILTTPTIYPGFGYQIGDTVSFTVQDTLGTTFDLTWTVAEIYEDEWRLGGVKKFSGINEETLYEYDIAGSAFNITTSGIGTDVGITVNTRYAPGSTISTGTFEYVSDKDPLAQQTYVDLMIQNSESNRIGQNILTTEIGLNNQYTKNVDNSHQFVWSGVQSKLSEALKDKIFTFSGLITITGDTEVGTGRTFGLPFTIFGDFTNFDIRGASQMSGSTPLDISTNNLESGGYSRLCGSMRIYTTMYGTTGIIVMLDRKDKFLETATPTATITLSEIKIIK